MASESVEHTTTDHDEIKQWVQSHDGVPAVVASTQDKSGGGVLRIDFPGGSEDGLTEVGWDEWFETFDSRGLAFLYQARKADGEDSTFCKLIDADE
ncbi:hypothetical protein [Flexivirga lutea]